MPGTDRQTEIEIARELLAGNTDAFERFVDIFRPRIFQYSLLVCGHREDAEEVAQDTLFKAFENLGQLRDPERVRPWMFRIAKTACLMKRRRSVFAPARELSLEELMPAREHNGHASIQIADWSALPDTELLRSELREVIADAIAQLPDLYRPVILLRDIEELSTEETAQILELSEDVVKTRLHRARLAIRKHLDEYLRSVRPAK